MVSTMQSKEEGLNININHNYFNSKFIIEDKKNQLLHSLLNSEDILNERNEDGITKMTYRSGQFFKTSSNNTKYSYSLKKRISYVSTHSKLDESTTKLQFNRTMTNNKSLKDLRKSVSSSIHTYEQLAPCTNCGKLVKIEDVEDHTDLCTIVKEEIVVSEISNNPTNIINFKLEKLEENCSQVILETHSQTDLSNMTLLKHYINLGKDYNNSDSVMELKNVIAQIDSVLLGFKGSFLSLILYERVNVILKEKYKLMSNESPLKFKVRGGAQIRDPKIRQHITVAKSHESSVKSAPKVKLQESSTCKNNEELMSKPQENVSSSIGASQENKIQLEQPKLQEEISPIENEGLKDINDPQIATINEDPKVLDNINTNFHEDKERVGNYDVSQIEKINNDEEDDDSRLDETNNHILMKIFSANVVNEINSIISNASGK